MNPLFNYPRSLRNLNEKAYSLDKVFRFSWNYKLSHATTNMLNSQSFGSRFWVSLKAHYYSLAFRKVGSEMMK